MLTKRESQGIKLLGIILVVSFLFFLGRFVRLDVEVIERFLRALPLFISSILYLFLYVIVTFFVFLSKDVFWVAGALIFGPYLSAFLICAAETVNACILFYIARRFGRSYVENKLSAKYKFLDERIARINFFWLLIFRIAPLIPYRFLDLAAGLTKIKFSRYILAVVLGTPLKTFWIQYIISGVGRNIFREPHALTQYFIQNKFIFVVGFIYLFLILLVIFKIRKKD